MEIRAAKATEDLAAPLKLLEKHLREDDPLPETFRQRLREAIDAGSIDVLLASQDGTLCGVAVISYRPSVSLGGTFASIEDLYVRPDARRRGVGRALLETANRRCSERNISYLEVQVESSEAASFYLALGYDAESEVEVFSRSLALRLPGEVF